MKRAFLSLVVRAFFVGLPVVCLVATQTSHAHDHHATSHTLSPLYPYQDGMARQFRVPTIGLSATFNEEYHNRKIAEWSLQQVNASLPQLADPWVNELVYRTAASMNGLVRHQSLLSVPIINDSGINAFAVPGGLVAINTGVITASKSLDETASVLAHEIAHLSLRHYERNQDEKGKRLAMQLGGLLAALAVSAASGDAAAAAMIGAQAMGAETAAAHSRGHEREADRVGMQILAQAGFDARAMPRFFETLQRQIGLNTSGQAFVPTFVQSHPLTLERLSEANARAPSYPSASRVLADEHAKTFDLLVWRVKYLSGQASEQELRQAMSASDGATLALAAYLADKGRFDEARTVMMHFGADDISPLVCVTRGHIAYEAQDFHQAVAILRACHAIYPERRDLAVYLADSLVFAGQTYEAQKLLLPMVQKAEHDRLAWQLLQKSYEIEATTKTGTQKDLAGAKALQARGYQELWRGAYEKALQSFTQAQSLAVSDSVLAGRLTDDIAKVREFQAFKL